MEELTSLIKSVNPLSLEDVEIQVNNDLSEFILYKVKIKYDTQATVERIIADLKELERLKKNVGCLEEEISKTWLFLKSTPECSQEPIKTYLDGLQKAWRIMDGNRKV